VFCAMPILNAYGENGTRNENGGSVTSSANGEKATRNGNGEKATSSANGASATLNASGGKATSNGKVSVTRNDESAISNENAKAIL
jgi:hypothetical protein